MRLRDAALAAIVLAAADGCGSPAATCGEQTPPVSAAPASCTAVTGTKITVPVRVCPRCDQETPTCLVHTENASGGQITLEPVALVCDPSSCPTVDPATCQFQALACAFTAPAPGSYQLIVATPANPLETPLTVVAGTEPPPATQCSF